jgi:hypothetical protein
VDGDLLIRWTIRLSLGLYVAVLFGWLSIVRGQLPAPWMRPLWTLGCLLALVHVACAFHFLHGWSHEAAYQETARQTGEQIGIAYGGGLWWNYAFLGVWLVDVLWWWAAPARYLKRPLWLGGLIQGFLGFMAFNGTVVFAVGWTRWAGIASCLGLLLGWLFRLVTARQVTGRSEKP